MYIYVFFICMYNICLFLMEIYYEELSPVVMEAEKFHDLRLHAGAPGEWTLSFNLHQEACEPGEPVA